MSKILVIEDSPEVRERIVASLTFEGFDVVDAEDGVAGLQAAREIDPDLIICDILMPRLDGHATLSELRKDSSTAGIPFIFLSAKSQVSDLREGLQLGADDYLVKPFALKELIAAVKLRLRRREELSGSRNGGISDAATRRDFESEFGEALARGKAERVRVAVFMIQIIGMERIRRTLGGEAVESVLAEAKTRLSALQNSGYESICSLGEGKFAAVLVGNSLPMAADKVCAQLFACLSLPFERDGAGVNLAAAAGIALCPTHGVDREELIARADAALDAVSEKGEMGYRFYTGELESRASQRHDKTASIFRAFQDGKFEMRYRVEVECRTQRPEVIRCVPTWRHPERGLVSVYDYQPLVEEAGILDKFFDWALTEVARQKASWRDREWGYLPLALNVSAPQLLDVRLAPRIARVLSEFEVEGREFELLFATDMLQADPKNLAPMLLALKAYGLKLTVDGFAVGAQLLENWRGLPLDNLSLEGGILNSASTNHADRLLLTALISLAHGIGLKVNASNIDSEEMLGLLRRLQCDGIRRYRSDAALLPRKVEGLLRRRRLF